MKTLLNWIMVLVVLVSFTAGCGKMGMVSKGTKVKCPKCGAVFTVDEGIKAIEVGA